MKVAILAAASDDAALMRIADPAASPLEAVASRDLAQRIITAVEALPLEQRGASMRAFTHAGLFAGRRDAQDGVAVETAKSRLRYARTKLREAFAGERSVHV